MTLIFRGIWDAVDRFLDRFKVARTILRDYNFLLRIDS